MARKNPFPPRELAIAHRVREFRRHEKLSQVAFATSAGIDSSALASVEHARAPLRYALAWRLANAHLINPRWLATGEGRPAAREGLPVPDSVGIDPQRLFSEVFDEWMKTHGEIPHPEAQTPDEVRTRCEWTLEGRALNWLDSLRDADVVAFTDRLLDYGAKLHAQFKPDKETAVKEREAKRSSLSSELRFKVFRRSHYK